MAIKKTTNNPQDSLLFTLTVSDSMASTWLLLFVILCNIWRYFVHRVLLPSSHSWATRLKEGQKQ